MSNIIDFKSIRHNRYFTMVSLFAGAGGLDIGFENQGFKTIWANDIDYDACRKTILPYNIFTISGKPIWKIYYDFVVILIIGIILIIDRAIKWKDGEW